MTCEGVERAEALEYYGELLASEADHAEHLMHRAWLEFPASFEHFSLVAQSYFVAASYEESRQRLLDPPAPGWAWQGFLGSGDEAIARAFRHLGNPGSDLEQLPELLDGRNVGGFFAGQRAGEPTFYPVDLAALERSCLKLGLDSAEYERRCHRLRSPDSFAEAKQILALESDTST